MIVLAAIEQWPLVRWIGAGAGVYPVLSALHILSIALVAGPILLVDLRLIGALRSRALDPGLALLARTSMVGAAMAVATGLLIASVQITKYVVNGPFLLKMALIALAGLNAFALRRAARAGTWPALVGTARGRAAGAISLLLWLGVILAGRWIAFV